MQLAKAERQRLIESVVSRKRVGTQFELLDALAASGCNVTQATISRDIRDGSLKKYLIQPLDMIGYLLAYRAAHKCAYIATSFLPYPGLVAICNGFAVGSGQRVERLAHEIARQVQIIRSLEHEPRLDRRIDGARERLQQQADALVAGHRADRTGCEIARARARVGAALAPEPAPDGVDDPREQVQPLLVRMDRRLDGSLGSPPRSGALRLDLRAARRLLVLRQVPDLVPRQPQLHASLRDLPDLLGGDVDGPAQQTGRHRQPVEDVVA